MNILRGDYVEILMRDGTVMSGTVEKIGSNHLVLDEDRAFGDWICIYYADIIDIGIN